MLIDLVDVSKIYGEFRQEIKALDKVNLSIDNGEIITIMGPSGSGKTTLLNLIGAMDKPTSGNVLINNKDVGSLPERSLADYRRFTIGFVFQNYYLIPNVNVIGNVLMPLIPYRVREKHKILAMQILQEVSLGHRITSNVNKLSGGESQRVAIARALINDPKIILADEPTGNLDSSTGKNIIDLLIKLSKQGRTVLIVTHDARIAKTIASIDNGRNIWIKDGRLIDDPNFDLSCWD